jgi:hypothetical protein
MLIAALLLATLPGTRPALDLAAFVSPDDCTPALRSRLPDGTRPVVCDLVPAFARAVAACEASIAYVPAEARRPACVMTLPPGEFELSRPLRLARPVVLRGAGGAHWATATVLRTRTSTHGIVVEPSAAGSMVTDLAVISGQSSHATMTAGVDLRGRATLERLWVRLFVAGVQVSADVMRSPPSNANGSRLRGLVIDRTEGPAVLVRGGDANDVSIVELETAQACERGSWWSGRAELVGRPCAAVIDRSFLGVSVWAAHTASSRDRETGARFAGYDLGGDSTRSICAGCYSESDQTPSAVGRQSIAIGGIGAWQGLGLRVEGPRLSSLLVSSPALPGGGWVDLAAGAITAPGVGLELRGAGIPGEPWRPLRLLAEPARLAWRLDVAGLGTAVTARVGATASARGGLGALELIRTTTIAR